MEPLTAGRRVSFGARAESAADPPFGVSSVLANGTDRRLGRGRQPVATAYVLAKVHALERFRMVPLRNREVSASHPYQARSLGYGRLPIDGRPVAE